MTDKVDHLKTETSKLKDSKYTEQDSCRRKQQSHDPASGKNSENPNRTDAQQEDKSEADNLTGGNPDGQ